MLWSEENDEARKTNDEIIANDALGASSSFDIRHSSCPHPFRNCIVLGLMLSEWYEDKKDPKKIYLTEAEAKAACGAKGAKQVVGKMSKSKRNYPEPAQIFDKYGADALRWYFLANQPPWTSIRYSEQAIKDSIPEFLLRLWNCYSFLVIYANIDEWEPSGEAARLSPSPASGEGLGEGETRVPGLTKADPVPTSAPSPNPSPHGGRGATERDELDRWIVSELHRTIATVTDRMDAYDNYAACAAITDFVDGLSNWWVRRSRERFWAKEKQAPAKLDAYATLYECLVTTSKLIAPFTPFLAETFWRNLASGIDAAPESVHLCDYPVADASLINEALSERMAMVRLISSLGRRAREGASLKVRQPLSKVEVILADNKHQAWLEEHASVIADELNVKAVEYSDEPEKYVDHQVLPNFKLLGKKLGKLMPKVKQQLNAQSGSELLANLRDNGKINLTVEGEEIELSPEEVEVRITAKEGWAAANDKGVVVVLSTELTPELIAEGLARDLVRVIQDRRKEIGCEFTDRVKVGIVTESELLKDAVNQFGLYIQQETLASSLWDDEGVTPETPESRIGEETARVSVRK